MIRRGGSGGGGGTRLRRGGMKRLRTLHLPVQGREVGIGYQRAGAHFAVGDVAGLARDLVVQRREIIPVDLRRGALVGVRRIADDHLVEAFCISLCG